MKNVCVRFAQLQLVWAGTDVHGRQQCGQNPARLWEIRQQRAQALQGDGASSPLATTARHGDSTATGIHPDKRTLRRSTSFTGPNQHKPMQRGVQNVKADLGVRDCTCSWRAMKYLLFSRKAIACCWLMGMLALALPTIQAALRFCQGRRGAPMPEAPSAGRSLGLQRTAGWTSIAIRCC